MDRNRKRVYTTWSRRRAEVTPSRRQRQPSLAAQQALRAKYEAEHRARQDKQRRIASEIVGAMGLLACLAAVVTLAKLFGIL